MMRFVRIATIIVLTMIATHAQAAGFDHSAFDRLLRDTVSSDDGGRSTVVDYARIKQSRAMLSAYLDRTSAVMKNTFDAWPKPEQLAFLINVYNARTIDLVLDSYPGIASIKDIGSLLSSPWKKKFVPLFGKTLSLDDIEHGLIRGSGRYGDPRIHFAVNCASIGCPALRAEAYFGTRLDAQLEDQTVLFLSDGSRNRLKGDTIEVSPIFKWYRKDFEAGFRGATSLEAFLATYAAAFGLDAKDTLRLVKGDIAIRFQKYDWRLNSIR